jgi:molybdopterin-containing oxidoreductase family iron-sulfur binding subunit
MNDPQSRLAELKDTQRNPLHFALLGELNTRPRTTYSASLRNPHFAEDTRRP